jgi:hypothetical protein
MSTRIVEVLYLASLYHRFLYNSESETHADTPQSASDWPQYFGRPLGRVCNPYDLGPFFEQFRTRDLMRQCLFSDL